MGTKVDLQPVSIQNNNKTDDTTDPEDQPATQPIILQFLQEASKLAAPSHRNPVDSTFDPVTSDRKDAHPSNNCSDAYPQHSWAQTFSYNGEENSDMYMFATHIGADLQGSNPWEVMSLINLQCEKLLHHRGQGGSDCTTTSFSSSESNSIAYPPPSEPDDSLQGRGVLECSSHADVQPEDLLFLTSRGGESSCVTPLMDDDMGESSSESLDKCPVQRCTTNAKLSLLAESQPYDGRPLPVDENAGLCSQPAHRAAMEVKLSVTTGSERDMSGSPERSSEFGTRSGTSDEAWPQTHLSPTTDDACGYVAEQSAHESDKGVCLGQNDVNAVGLLTTDATVPLDFNSNLLLTFDPLADAGICPTMPKQPAWAVLSNEELSQNKSQTNKTPEPECIKGHLDHNARLPSTTQQSCFTWMRDSDSTGPQQCVTSAEDVHTPAAQQGASTTSSVCRTNTRRKQSHPNRSADATDPDFQGVMFRMQGELDHSRGQCQLLVISKYRISSSHRRKPRQRTRSTQSSLRTSSSDEDLDPSTSSSKSKECASCCTKKTPMWRDAEDGTPLCNACGIRYKKYRVRCVNCWHIPRKEGNTHSRCLKCGNSVRTASALHKHTAC